MPPKRRPKQTSAPKSQPAAAAQPKPRWDLTPPRTVVFALLAALAAYLAWYWAGRYGELIYLTHYYEVPRPEFLTYPGGAVAILGDLPGILAARTAPAIGAALVILYSLWLPAGFCALLPGCDSKKRLPLTATLALPSVVILTVLFSRQGYYHFSVVRSGLFLGAFPALAAGLSVAAAARKIADPKKQLLASLAALALFYILFGGYTLIPVLFLARDQWRQKQSGRLWRALLILVFGGLVPLLWYPCVSGHFPMADLWTAGFPSYRFEITDPVNAAVSTRLFIAALVTALLPICLPSKKETAPPETSPADPPQPEAVPTRGRFLGALLAIFSVAAAISVTELFSRTEVNFLALVAAVRPLEHDQWEKILEIESRCEEPTLPLIELRRLALAQTGQMAERLFQRPNAPSYSTELAWIQCLRLLGSEVCYRSGSVNFAACYTNDQLRLCPESPYLRWLLVQYSLTNEEYSLAEKYLSLLEPLCRGDWVRDARDLLDAHRAGTEPRTDRGKALAKRIETARRLRPSEYLLHGRYVDRNILFSATKEPFDDAPREDQERFLCDYLLVGAHDLFESNFKTYYQKHLEPAGERIPTALQQGAAYIEYTRTNKTPREYPYDPEIPAGLTDFSRLCGALGQQDAAAEAQMQALASSGTDQSAAGTPTARPAAGGIDPRAAAEKIQEKYTNTFWFYRMFASPYQEY